MSTPVTAPGARSPAELFARAVDAHFMRAQFQRLLPALSTVPIRVTACEARPARALKVHRQKLLRVVYRVRIEAERGRRWEHTLVGTVPVSPDFLGPEIQSRCRAARGHEAAAPFRRLCVYAKNLQMAVLLFPVDPGLPGLTEVIGPDGARLLAPHLEECRNGAEITGAAWELLHYRPSARCVVRVDLNLAKAHAHPWTRSVFVKVFGDDRAGIHWHNLRAVWEVSRRSQCLRVPRPLGYDAQHRLLILDAEPQKGDLAGWIEALANGEALPEGVGMARLERCMAQAAGTLSELQGCRCELTRERTYRGELARLHRDAAAARERHAELGPQIERLLDSLGAQPVDNETLVPAHGSFRHRMAIGGEDGLTLLDWDGLCLANPALDAANFLGHLRQGPLRRPGSASPLEHLAGVFRRAFVSSRPEVSAPQLAAYESLMLMERALRSLRRPEAGSAAEQARHLLTAAEAGLNGWSAHG